MVDDDVGHDVNEGGQLLKFVPTPESGIDPCVVDGIKSRIGTVYRIVERQQMDGPEEFRERTGQRSTQSSDTPSSEPIDVSSELDFVFHMRSEGQSMPQGTTFIQSIVLWISA